MARQSEVDSLQAEIVELETRLYHAKSRLTQLSPSLPMQDLLTERSASTANTNSAPFFTHALLLLSDSALPLGSFAYSMGLESYLAHNKPFSTSVTPIASFRRFLHLSVASVASTSLPYLLAAYRGPEALETLDNDLDASMPCVVSQRASVAQGRALLGVWQRAFRGTYAGYAAAKSEAGGPAQQQQQRGIEALETFSDTLKSSGGGSDDQPGPMGHLAPLWGVVCLAMGVEAWQATYVFMLNHVKSVLSAAVRASVMGPYQAQSVLASKDLQDMIFYWIEREWNTAVENAGQRVPALDLWAGRHELLYSRIFNS